MSRYVIPILAGLVALLAAYWFLTSPSRARKETAVAQATTVTAEGQKAAAQDTIKIVVDSAAAHDRIDIVTQGNRDAILSAPGAAEAVGSGVHNAGLHALCLRDTYRLQPACQRLLDAGAEGPR